MEETTDLLFDGLRGYYRDFVTYLPRIAAGVIVIALGYLLASWLTRVLRTRLRGNVQDQIAARFLGSVAKLLLVIGVVILGLQVAGLGSLATGLFTALGASGLIVGFAFKDIGENFLAGVILAFSRPFDVGDTIEVDGYFGNVLQLAFRYTHIKTFDGKDVYVPNADVMNNAVTNYTADGFIRLEFVVGIAYEDDIDGAIKLVDRIVAEYPHIINTDEHPSFSCVDELAASTVNIKVRFWIETVNYRRTALEARGAFIREVKEQLNDAGFGLPADITELKLYGGEKSIPIELVNERGEGLPERNPPGRSGA